MTATVRRFASVIELPAEHEAEYRRLHRAVWPGVVAAMRRHGITRMSIHLFGRTLYSFREYEGEDFEQDMAAMGREPIVREWLAVCKPLQRPLPEALERGEWWLEIEEVFDLDWISQSFE